MKKEAGGVLASFLRRWKKRGREVIPQFSPLVAAAKRKKERREGEGVVKGERLLSSLLSSAFVPRAVGD